MLRRLLLLPSIALVTIVATACPPDPVPGPVTTTSTTTSTTTTTTTTTTLANRAPLAVDDSVYWDLRGGVTVIGDHVGLNDSDPDGDQLTASGGGTFSFDGDDETAGAFTVDADGWLQITLGTDPVGPIQRLGDGDTGSVTLSYSVSDGALTDTATVNLTIVGRDDEPVLVGNMVWPSNELVDFNDPAPTVFDASDFVSAEGYQLQFSWSATSSVALPPHPALVGNANVVSFSVHNYEWGFNSQVTVQLNVIPMEGFGGATQVTTSFFVTDAGFD